MNHDFTAVPDTTVPGQTRVITVALLGNPNCGKTTLFNKLTGLKQNTGNYPRVTVSIKAHEFTHRGVTIRLVDLPGVYSLNSQSPEERVGRDFIQDQNPDIVLNLLDAGNLERSLFLTTQLIEMGGYRLFALNMIDEARKRGITFDTSELSTMLGGPVIETMALNGEGLDRLLDAIVDLSASKVPASSMVISYDKHLEQAIVQVQGLVTELHPGKLEPRQSRWLAIKLLEGDDDVLHQEADHAYLIEMIRRFRYDLARTHGESAEIMVADARYGFIHGLLAEARTIADDYDSRLDITRRIDRVVLNRVLGLPIFLFLLWLMFEATFKVGAYPMDWLDAGVKWSSNLLDGILPAGMAHDLIVNGIVAGVGGTIVFLPNIAILFFFMALFNETGYLARATFLMDRVMHVFGLHGKAFIPLVMGFDCNVPAIMATRTIEVRSTRLIAILIAPFTSCSARLPVFILFSGAFFTKNPEMAVFAIYLVSIGVGLLSAVFLGRFVVHGGQTSFVMELPPYRRPTVRGVLFHMGERVLTFLYKVGGIILVGSIAIWFLQQFPRDITWSKNYDAEVAALNTQQASPTRDEALARLDTERKQERLEKSYLGRASIAIMPVFKPLGFTWRDTTAIMTSVMAKEVAVATYSILYNQDRDPNSQGLRAALAGTMTPLTAFAFMVFVLLYAPCLSTIAAIRHETSSWGWAAFSVVYSFTLAWILAFGIVTIGRVFI
ncbi:MAG: ferrous iron transport protein B [Alphaproteobacteria bacterium]|nr:ferrous iron transport protein B [Alphaproteobacteria bacterium]